MQGKDSAVAAPVIFGEVLFDHFPDGNRVLGGAPFNVAWHLKGFGLDPLMVSAVGNDVSGAEVLERMVEWGMRTDGVQRHDTLPTGRVSASVVAGEPHFDIEPEQAYDYIDPAHVTGVVPDHIPLLYYGSLALRSGVSRGSLEQIRGGKAGQVFVDINLRAPWWTEERVRWCLEGVDWAKLNDTELATLTPSSTATLGEDLATLAAHLEIGNAVLTLGENGAVAWDGGELIQAGPAEVPDFVDSVGAGDAFSSVTCFGILRRWDLATTLVRANAFAADVCAMRGATTNRIALYREHLASWSSDDADL